ncbi:MAG: hypothetical protein ACO20I_15875, partial [bacterium]
PPLFFSTPMFRSDDKTQNGGSLRYNPASHEDIWGRNIVETKLSESTDADTTIISSPQSDPTVSNDMSTNVVLMDNYYSVLFPPGSISQANSPAETFMYRTGTSRYQEQTLNEWIQVNKHLATGDLSEKKQYYERCTRLLHSLILKCVINVMNPDKKEMDMEVSVDSQFMVLDNIMVRQCVEVGEDAFFIQSDMEGRDFNLVMVGMKYSAMKAMGIVAYQLLMRGLGPPISAFLPSTVTGSDGTARLLLSLDDHDDSAARESNEMVQAKRQRAQDKSQGRLANVMVNSGVPYPLCRFTVDLLGGECSDGLLFRSDDSFQSFSDVLDDLRQMTESPDAFIHLSSPVKDQWRISIGSKMHGRDSETGVLMDVSSRIRSSTPKNDPLFEALALLPIHNKNQFVTVTGKPGAGEARVCRSHMSKHSIVTVSLPLLHCRQNSAGDGDH